MSKLIRQRHLQAALAKTKAYILSQIAQLAQAAESDLARQGLAPCTHKKTGAVHALSAAVDAQNLRFAATADFAGGDTFSLNGRAVSARTFAGEPLWPGYFKAGSVVVCHKNGNSLTFGGGSRKNLMQSSVYDPQGKARDVFGYRVYSAHGNLLNGETATAVGTGTAVVLVYPNGLVKVDFRIKITVAGTKTVFDVGVNRDLIKTCNPDIPKIQPLTGGVVTYYSANGALNPDANGLGGMLENRGDQFWRLGRVYKQDGATGLWPDNTFTQGMYLAGTCYGTLSNQ